MTHRRLLALLFVLLISAASLGQKTVGHSAVAKNIIFFVDAEDGVSRFASWGQRLVVASVDSATARVIFPDGMIALCNRSDLSFNEELTMKDLQAKAELASLVIENSLLAQDDDGDNEHLKEWKSFLALYSRRLSEMTPSSIPPAEQNQSLDTASPPREKVTNDTKYRLVVSFTGPTTTVRTVSPGATVEFKLKPGLYTVLVRAPGTSIEPFHSKERVESGWIYSHKFVIVTKRGL